MTEKHKIIFFRIFGILLSISIVAAGLCLIYGCLSIYYTGDRTYSRQIVIETFNTIAIPVYVCLGLSVISIILNILFPAHNTKHKVKKNLKTQLEFLLRKKLIDSDSAELSEITKERKRRRLIKALEYSVIALSSLAFLIYALNGKYFDNTQINSSMINAIWVLLPCLVIMFAAAVIAEIYINKSIIREIELITGFPSAKTNEPPQIKSDRKILIIRSVILLAGIGFVIYGFAAGGVADVLTKAVNICTECIGLG